MSVKQYIHCAVVDTQYAAWFAKPKAESHMHAEKAMLAC